MDEDFKGNDGVNFFAEDDKKCKAKPIMTIPKMTDAEYYKETSERLKAEIEVLKKEKHEQWKELHEEKSKRHRYETAFKMLVEEVLQKNCYIKKDN